MVERYQVIRQRAPALARFDTAAALSQYFADLGGDLDEKDRIYAVLTHEYQSRSPAYGLAFALIWCGLWPNLDRLYLSRLRTFGDDPEDLAQEIAQVFATVLQRLDLGGVTRVAATITRNIERVLVARCRRFTRGRGRSVELDVVVPTATATYGTAQQLDEHLFWRDVAPMLGEDAALVMAVFLEGRRLHELAERFGSSYIATRKRFLRAVKRLGRGLDKGPGVR
jgi:DNA-directed RNA polymerase specialized sigma24 family protein